MTVLKPGGRLAIDFENAVSLMRRLRVAMGTTNADAFDAYYTHRIHKRYWTAADLVCLGRHLRLADMQVVGRNWSVYQSRKRSRGSP
jgi:hypothetical protein